MASRVAVLFAVAVTCFDSAALSQTAPTATVDLQRLVFGMGEPAFPDTPEKLDAQLELAAAYAVGAGVERDIELACGLAQTARHLAAQGGDDSPSYLRAQRAERDLCASVHDLYATLRLAACPRFGIAAQTLDLGSGALLVAGREGWRIDDRSGAHEGEWPINCGDALVSMRLTHVGPPAKSMLATRTFIELLVWHQSHRTDGSVGDRSLDWRLLEFRAAKSDLNHVDGVGVQVDPRASIWPVPPVPPAVEGGATFQMLPTGEVRWRFASAPELGTAVIPPLVP